MRLTSSQNHQFCSTQFKIFLDFTSPLLNKPLATKSWQKLEEFATFSVQLGYDSSPRREPKFSHAIWFLVALNPLQIASKFVAPSTHNESKSVSKLLGEFKVRNAQFRRGMGPVHLLMSKSCGIGVVRALESS